MKPELAVILGIFLVFIGLEIIFTRFFKKDGQTAGDAIVEIASTLAHWVSYDFQGRKRPA